MSEELNTIKFYQAENQPWLRVSPEGKVIEFNEDNLRVAAGHDITAYLVLKLVEHLRAELSAIKVAGEAVAWMHSRSGAVATAATKSAMEDGSIPSGYDVPLYTHPPVVAEAEPVEVVGYGFKHVDNGWMFSSKAYHEVNPCLEGFRLMTVAQHQRIVAAITAPPASGAVPVPMELLTVACSGGNEAWQALEEIRALLAKGVV